MARKPSSYITGLVAILIFLVPVYKARPVAKLPDVSSSSVSSSDLLYRLKLDGGESSNYCWDSLVQLQACSGELIMFFLNGETYLGPGCCKAIHTVGHHCWPNMLGTLGFTAQEGDILQGYCEDHDSDDGNDGIPPPVTYNLQNSSKTSAP